MDPCILHFSMKENYKKALRRLNKKLYKHYSDNDIKLCAANIFRLYVGKKVQKVETLQTNRIIGGKIFAAITLNSENQLWPISLRFSYIDNYWKLVYYKIGNFHKTDFNLERICHKSVLKFNS
ncbi:MAG: hypothetical protein LBT85_01480 [Bifidobacteriaceae bacterium]|jgi:hypothetical protein|nr:hypothetical protein [Bifidobacteriaceae bacterium]